MTWKTVKLTMGYDHIHLVVRLHTVQCCSCCSWCFM